MMALPVAHLQNRAEADRLLAEEEPDAGIRSFLLHNLIARDGHYAWRINLAAIGAALPDINGFPDLTGHYNGPTLFLRGERSQAVQPEHLSRIGALFPRATVTTLPGAGHWPHAETPEQFLTTLRNFLGHV